MRDILLLLIMAGVIPFIFRKPFFGVLAWCWVSYMVPHKLTFGFMQNFPIAQLVAVVFLGVFIFSKEPKKVPFSSITFWLFAFYFWILLTYLVHTKSAFVDNLAIKILKIQLFTIVILMLLTTRERIEQTLWVIGLSIAFYGVKGGIFTISTGGSGRVWGPPGGYFEGNNELGLTLVITIPILLYLRKIATQKWVKNALMVAIVLCAISALGTQSRGAFLAISACGLFYWLKSNKKLVTAIPIVILAASFVTFMPQSWHDRMDTIFVENEDDYDGSIKGRLNAWRMAVNIAGDNLTGGGLNAATPANFLIYAPEPERFHDFHSIYFQILGKHGYPGLFIYLMIFMSTWFVAQRIRKKTKAHQELDWAYHMMSLLQVSLIAFAVGGAFLGLAYFDLPYHLVITVAAVNTVVNKRLAELSANAKADSAIRA